MHLQWNPLKMLVEKEPAVMTLMAQYRNVPMPSLKLSDGDVADVVEFVADETKRHRASFTTLTIRSPHRITIASMTIAVDLFTNVDERH